MTGAPSRRSFRLRGEGSATQLLDALLPDGVTVERRFEPHGHSVARIGAEGTVALHTWPEHAIATLDVYGLAAPTNAALTGAGWHLIEEDPWT